MKEYTKNIPLAIKVDDAITWHMQPLENSILMKVEKTKTKQQQKP